MNLIEQRLSELRQEYKTATPDRRKEILFTVETIKRSDYLNPKREDEFKQTVMDNLK